MRAVFFSCILVFGLVVSGCSSGPARMAVPNLPQAMPADPPGGSLLLTASTHAGDALHKMLLLRMGSGGGILTTSLVDLHNFSRTSAFGRVTSQQVASRIGQYGFRIVEARIAASLAMTSEGEFMLTRESAKLLADTYDANAVLVGCYADSGSNVFVSLRVVRLSDNAVVAAYEYYLPRGGDVARLLAGYGGGDPVWERYGARKQAFAPDAGASPAGAPCVAAATTPAVPRYVDPGRPAPAPAKKAAAVKKARAPARAAAAKPAPAASEKPAPARVEPVPAQKDSPAPPGTPGGPPLSP